MIEKRLTLRLEKYWHRLRKEEPLPNFAHWNPSSIDDIWPNCMVMIAEPSAQGEITFKYSYVGQKIEGTWGHGIQGKPASAKAMGVFKGTKIIRRIDEVLDTAAPVFADGQFINDKSKVVKYRACLLPFGADTKVSHIVLGLSWKEFG